MKKNEKQLVLKDKILPSLEQVYIVLADTIREF